MPLKSFRRARPVLLIGSDHLRLIVPVEPVRLGPSGGPAAIRTRLGWTLQGPAQGLKQCLSEQQCYFLATTPPSDDPDDITCQKPLPETAVQSSWGQGPLILEESPDQWPESPRFTPMAPGNDEPQKAAFCGLTTILVSPSVPDAPQFEVYSDLIKVTAMSLHGAASTSLVADDHRESENILLQQVQQECFTADQHYFREDKPLLSSSRSRLLPLLPELHRTPNILSMGRPDASRPNVLYPHSELLGRCRPSQLLADHVWKHFLRFYLPSRQAQQSEFSDTSNIQVSTTVMVLDYLLPQASWSVERVTPTLPGADSKGITVEVKVGDRSYTPPMAHLIRPQNMPD